MTQTEKITNLLYSIQREPEREWRRTLEESLIAAVEAMEHELVNLRDELSELIGVG